MDFGVLSTSGIARAAVIPAIQKAGHDVIAICSRDGERAAEAADAHGIPRSYGSYEELLADDDVEAVYNPLPNSEHAEWTKRAADHGRHVLCEKPLAPTAATAREMGEHCREQGVVLMEAFMYRYHPRTERAMAVVEEELSTVRSVEAAFRYPLRGYPDAIQLRPELEGGSLLDVGVYPVTAVKGFLGQPNRVYASQADTRGEGVDTQTTCLLEYDGATAQLSSGFDTQTNQFYRVDAENGWLVAENAFAPSSRSAPEGVDPAETVLRYSVDGREVEETFDPVDQFSLEVEHFVDCVNEGRTPRTDAKYATSTLDIVDAIVESADENRPVDLA